MPPPPPQQRNPAPQSNRMGAPSLVQCATKLLINKVKEIDDVGRLDLRLVRPIINKVTDPSKLRLIEQNSPQVAGEFPELWKKFIARDFGADPEKYVPANPTLWPKVYAKHAKEAEARDKAASDLLISKFDALKNKKSQHAPVLIKNPYKEAWSRNALARPRQVGYVEDRDNWEAATGSRTKDLFKKIKREAQASKTKLAVPTHLLKARSRISKEVVDKLKASSTPVTDPHPPAGLKRPAAGDRYEGSPEKKSRIGGPSHEPYPGYLQRPAHRPEPTPAPTRQNGLNSTYNLHPSSSDGAGSRPPPHQTYTKSTTPHPLQSSPAGSSQPRDFPQTAGSASGSARPVIYKPRKEVNMFHQKRR